MKKKIIPGIIALLTVFILSACEQAPKNQKKAVQMPPQQVMIINAHKKNVPLSFEYPARIISDTDIELKSEVSGTILEIFFKAGQNVKKGDKLFKIDPKTYEAAYNIQVANLNAAQAKLKLAEKDYKRSSVLIDKKATSQKSYDAAFSNYQLAKASVEQAAASKEFAKINLDNTDVKAQFDGIAGDSLVDKGQFVPPNTSLVRLTKINPVYANFYIPDVEQFNINNNIKNNLWSRLNSSASVIYGGKKYEGKITFIDKIVDPQNGSVQAKAEFENKNNELPVGSFAKITLDSFNQKNAFKIPAIALQQDLATTFVYVAGEIKNDEKKAVPKNTPPIMIPDGVVKMVPIKIDYQTDDFVLVSQGLKENDKIIMNNFKKIRPGAKIKIIGIYGQQPKQISEKMEKK
ncbi:MAG: efflux transporter periplasmic adaptor subunit [Deltaproteobacteria bacterium]|nr:MAG: efflux transporter periplasmic adaptor subunit [Deltaproteobacteria bacterium]